MKQASDSLYFVIEALAAEKVPAVTRSGREEGLVRRWAMVESAASCQRAL